MAYKIQYHHQNHHHRSNGRFSNTRIIIIMVLMVVGLFSFVFNMGGYGRTSHGRRLREDNNSQLISCLPCDCDDCYSETERITLSVSLDCGKDDPEAKEEMKKNISSLLREEIDLLKIVSDDNLRKTEALTMDVKKMSSRYQKEAEKCNVGIETCEGAREMAEAELVKELKITTMWKRRAIELGWK